MVQISLNDIQLPDITHINYVFTQFTKIKTNSAHLKIHSIVDKTFLLERLIFRGALKLLVSGEFPASCQFFKKTDLFPRHWNPDPKILQLRRPWTLCGRPGATGDPTVTGDLGGKGGFRRATETEVSVYHWTPKKIPSKHRKTSGGMTGMSRGSFWRRL